MLSLEACGGGPSIRLEVGTQSALPRDHDAFVVSGEPNAGLVAADILKLGGNAVDAAVSLGFALAVTLPTSTGLGADGFCLRYDNATNSAAVLEFFNRRESPSYPRFVGGMFSLHTEYGSLPWAQVVSPSENLARFGVPVSEALASDLEINGGSLLGESVAAEIFMTQDRNFLKAGDWFSQPHLARTLSVVRSQYSVGLNANNFKNDVTKEITKVISLEIHSIETADVPTWSTLNSRANSGMKSYFYKAREFDDSGKVPSKDTSDDPRTLPAGTTSFIVGDRQGDVVACTLSVGEPFGSKIFVSNLGFFLHSDMSKEHHPDEPFVSALLVDDSTRSVALVANSLGLEAEKKLTDLLRVMIPNKNLDEKFETRTAGIDLARCKPAPTQERVHCRAYAGTTESGFAVIVNPE